MGAGGGGGSSAGYCDCFLNTTPSLAQEDKKESAVYYNIHPCNHIKMQTEHQINPKHFLQVT